ncbi:DUF3054 domain-containing protein [Halosolutus amylolyticus]|uniref:DUF3054 domain-containing protein n=1 Tax=Halosolutus amylolyticus TaxID=2932267 RepID=A0ABD5PNG5_9EURY|nr:DUF3054 domain-containing protein [Halosolutus amylolyticus]
MDTASRTTTRDGRVDRETLLLGAVDVCVVVAFVTVGLLSHGTNPIAEPIAALETIAPFVLGWLAIAPLAGVYGTRSTSIARVARVTAVAWIAAANVGLILRASPLFDGSAVWPFTLVMTGFGLLALVGWRVAYAAVDGSAS